MSKKILNGLDLQNQRITGLADGSSPTDAVTLQQVQAFIRGLDWKNSVRAATTANITTSAPQTIDGVSVIAGDRVLVKDQTTGSQNGIYLVAAGAWTRATDFDDSVEVTAAAAIPVEEGTVNGDAVFILTNNGAVTVGTTALTFTRLGGSGVSYTAGTNGGLTLSGSAFSILLDTGSGLALGAGGIKVDPTQFAALGITRKYAVNSPTGTTPTITHNLGTLDVTVAVFEISGGAEVECDIIHATTNTLTLGFAVAATSGQYRVVVTG